MWLVRLFGHIWRLAEGGGASGLGCTCTCSTTLRMHSCRVQLDATPAVCHGGSTATSTWLNPPLPVLAASSLGKALLWWQVQAAMQGCPGEAAQTAAHHRLPPGRQARGPGS